MTAWIIISIKPVEFTKIKNFKQQLVDIYIYNQKFTPQLEVLFILFYLKVFIYLFSNIRDTLYLFIFPNCTRDALCSLCTLKNEDPISHLDNESDSFNFPFPHEFRKRIILLS